MLFEIALAYPLTLVGGVMLDGAQPLASSYLTSHRQTHSCRQSELKWVSTFGFILFEIAATSPVRQAE
jgi:hypothetical protein